MHRMRVLAAIAVASIATSGPSLAAPADPPKDTGTDWIKSLEYPGTGGWELILTFADSKSVWLATRRNLSRRGAIVSVWRRVEHRDPVPAVWGGTIMGLVERLDVNCDNPAARLRNQTGFRGRNMANPVTPAAVYEEGQAKWEPAIPGTTLDQFVAWACTAPMPAAPTKS